MRGDFSKASTLLKKGGTGHNLECSEHANRVSKPQTGRSACAAAN
jgi:hypothetical protein